MAFLRHGSGFLTVRSWTGLAASSLSVAALVGLAGCGGSTTPSSTNSTEPPARGCTAIGCTNGFGISLEPSSGWAAGAYVFDIEADGVKQQCKGNLPLPSCETGPSLTCSTLLARIGESGCALPAASHGFASIDFETSPTKVKVRIERDGAVLTESEFTPTYRTSQPNGPDCGPVCTNAHASLNVPTR